MIVVEGMDNSGKTTLCKQLSQEFNLEIVHSPGAPDVHTPMANWLMFIEESFLHDALKKEHRIHDRHPVISEMVYGPALRGQNVLAGTDYEEDFFEFKPLIIYCRPPLHRIVDWGGREQMEGVKERHLDLVARYDQVMSRLQLKPYFYDYTLPDAWDRCYNHVGRWLAGHRLHSVQRKEVDGTE